MANRMGLVCDNIKQQKLDDEFLVKVKFGDFIFLVDETEYVVVEKPGW